MKNVLILVICMLLSAGVLCASTTPIPDNLMAPSVLAAEGAWSISLVPGDGDQFRLLAGDGGPMPLCPPAHPNCVLNQLKLQAGDGGPMPVCAPGKPCNNDQFKLQAGDGGPMPVCAPGKPCNNDQLKLQAGDGGPMPVCAPGKPCDNDQERLPMAL